MPKRKGAAESDDFVVQDSGDDGVPRTKKSKSLTGKATTATKAKPNRKSHMHNDAEGGQKQRDDSGDPYWDLKSNGTRRVGVNKLNNLLLVNIREFYQKDGKMLPGKKGIALPLDQFKTLIELLPQIEAELRARGEDVPRPDYEQGAPASNIKDVDGDVGEEASRGAREARQKAQNFEATSEEDN